MHAEFLYMNFFYVNIVAPMINFHIYFVTKVRYLFRYFSLFIEFRRCQGDQLRWRWEKLSPYSGERGDEHIGRHDENWRSILRPFSISLTSLTLWLSTKLHLEDKIIKFFKFSFSYYYYRTRHIFEIFLLRILYSITSITRRYSKLFFMYFHICCTIIRHIKNVAESRW
jgi:hypothetical protein